MILQQVARGIALFALAHEIQPVTYTDITARAGLHFFNANSPTSEKYLIETMTGGAAAIDFDNDGWPDIYLTNGARIHAGQKDGEFPDKSAPAFWNRLYRNNRDGTFSDVTERAGVKGKNFDMGVAVGDIDNDGFDDLVVTGYGGAVLYRNSGNGTFIDATASSGLHTEGWLSSAGFVDYDRDGKLDLFICRYLDWSFGANTYCGSRESGGRSYCHPDNFKPVSNYLFHNDGNGKFSDVSTKSRIGASAGKGLGVAFADFNGDGWPDITVANDSMQQFLFLNNKDGTFTESGLTSGAGYTDEGKVFAGMGTDAADVDDDGKPDIISTALSNETYAFFHNTGDATFNYDTGRSRLGEASRLLGGWGMRVFDYDNDGIKDVFFANSHVMDNIERMQSHLRYRQPLLLLKGAGNGRFTDVSAQSGAVFQQQWASRGAAFADFDNDGDIDVVVSTCGGPAYLLRNDGGNERSWIGFDLRGTRDNRDGLGAVLKLTAGSGRVQYVQATTGGSYQSASDRRVFFGLGNEESVKSVEVLWPSGSRQVIEHPQLRKMIKVDQQ